MSRSRKGSRSTAARQATGKKSRTLDGKVQADSTMPAVESAAAPVAAPPRSPSRRGRILKRTLIGIGVAALLLILGGFGWTYLTIQRTLPTMSGTIKFPGLSAPATITRDAFGVPHIVAETVEDLYAAQGYVHAQDRLFQMFQLRAAGQGRLAELLSPRLAETDRFLRVVGFRRAAQAEWEEMDADTRARLEAYARGVNEFLRTHSDTLPLEFGLLGVKMEEWEPVDTLTFGKLQAWDLTDSWDNDLLRADLQAKLGAERAAQLFPDYPQNGPFIVPEQGSSDALRLLQSYRRDVRPHLPNFGLEELGSNNWVVDGDKSATGKPLLANDPHLGVSNPSIWYQVHLSTTDGSYDAVGFSFAGAPGIVTGHNRHIAWGVTNTGADVQDLFLERLDAQGHPNQYLYGGEWLPMQIVTETIKVAGGEPITQTVRITRHGPIISDALYSLPVSPTLGSSLGGQAYSLRWTAHEPGTLLQSLAALQTASNWEEFRAALSLWSVPGQNFVYADREGNIGYQMTGVLPIRKTGDGSVPVPGSTGEHEWTGYIPFEELPFAYNPPQHYIATANNKPFGPDYQHDISGGWSAPWRISRIVEMLEAKEKLSIDDFKEMLADTRSPFARKVGEHIANLKPQDEETKRVVEMFKGWDGNLTTASTTAAIYGVFTQRVLTNTFGDDLGDDLYYEYVSLRGPGLRSIEQLLEKPDDPFWDSSETPEKEGRDDILLSSLRAAVGDLKLVLGDDMQEWQWGKIHTITPAHPFGSQPMLGGVFNLSTVPVGGDGTTVAVAPSPLEEPFYLTRMFRVRHHQSYRMVVDLGDWGNSQAIYLTGQSGQPYARHWGDMLSAWQRGEYNPMLYSLEDIEARKGGVLTLTP